MAEAQQPGTGSGRKPSAPDGKPRVSVSVSLDRSLLESSREAAATAGGNLSYIVREALTAYLKGKKMGNSVQFPGGK